MRQARYTEQINVLLPKATKDRIDALDQAHGLGVAEVVRQALAAGLAKVERQYRQAATTGDRELQGAGAH